MSSPLRRAWAAPTPRVRALDVPLGPCAKLARPAELLAADRAAFVKQAGMRPIQLD